MTVPVHASITLRGKPVDTIVIPLPHANLVLAVAPKGFVMCGYLDIHIAEKFQDAACIVRGVKTAEDLLSAAVVSVTPAAARLGVNVGDTGRTALEKMC